jgi:very-short-patch-repair endonuclease
MTDGAIAEIASRQCGLFSRAQLFAAGGTRHLVYRRLDAGRWLQLAPGVYSLPGWPDSWHRSLWIAHLDAGPHSVISHEAAAALHRLLNYPPGPVTLLTTHGDHHRPEPDQQRGRPRVRQARDLKAKHVTTVDGLPVTTIARTFCDLASISGRGRGGRGRIERAIDDAHLTRRCQVAEVAALAAEISRPGKQGLPWLRKTLAERGPGHAVPESALERRLLEILRKGGFRDIRIQHELPWRPHVPNRVDALIDARIIVEADSRRWHGRVDTMAEDRRRDRDALNHGYPVYRFLYEEVMHEGDYICATLRQALAAPARQAA